MNRWYEVHNELCNLIDQLKNKIGNGDWKNVARFIRTRIQYDSDFKEIHPWVKNAFETTEGIKTTEYFNKHYLIDPLQIFQSFHAVTSSKQNRINRINAWFRIMHNLLDIDKSVSYDNIDFSGCPALNPMQTLKFKNSKDIELLWNLYEQTRKGEFIYRNDTINNYLKIQGIGITSLSVFVFWINSDKYIPLDKNTLIFIQSSRFKEYSTGLNLTEEELEFNPIDLLILINNDTKRFTNKNNDIRHLVSSAVIKFKTHENIKQFSLLGIQLLGKSKYHKILSVNNENTLFSLDKRLIQEGSLILFDNSKRINVYQNNEQNYSIEVSAIVGKNGSGKSTLIDLIVGVFYNASIDLKLINKNFDGEILSHISELNIALYFEFGDNIYKLSSKDNLTSLELMNKCLDRISVLTVREKVELRRFKRIFYTLFVNYSIYAFNSNNYRQDDGNEWISSLLHKNDGYSTPLVIVPQRTNGNIEINNELYLTRQRLLYFLLVIDDKLVDDASSLNLKDSLNNKSFRYFNEDKYFKSIKIIGPSSSILKLENNYSTYLGNVENIDAKNILKHIGDEIINVLFIPIADKFELDREKIIPSHKRYLVIKLFKIIETYFSIDHLNLSESQETFIETILACFSNYINRIYESTSHITTKFRQAINYYRYSELYELYNNSDFIELDKINSVLNDLKIKYIEWDNDEFGLVPPFFDYTFFYEDKKASNTVEGNALSSGEEQMYAVLTNVLYHIKNIISLENGLNDIIPYNNILIFLDEIELYFHPEYQRIFIKKLLDSIQLLINSTNPIIFNGVHIIFTTHSPFILSDIPSQKVLKLENGKPKLCDNMNSFAGNIYDLLNDEFFLKDGAIGAFTAYRIQSILKKECVSKEDADIIDLIGDPFLKGVIKKQIAEKLSDEFLDNEIKRLQEIKNRRKQDDTN